jgi:NodT family efflux transporter outer membrane factor (OMF) lipoprotein
MTRRVAVPGLVLLLCVGCAKEPHYSRPPAPTPPALKELAGNDQWKMATPSDDLPKGKWWEVFGDPQLNSLEELVGTGNLNLRQAEAQFREARALVSGAHANYFPTIGTTPSITQTVTGPNSGRGTTGTNFVTYALPADVTWEPDLWGRVRLQVRGAVNNAQASAADLENVRLSEQALLAADYFSLAAEDMQQALLHDTIDAYQKNLQLTIDRFNGGVASRSDITLAQAQLAAATAQSVDLRAARAQLEHAVATLTGRPPVAVDIGDSRIAAPPPPIPTVVPSRLLERRPDIAASERQVAAASVSVGLAQLAFYPTLTLSANPALVATSLANLFSWASRSWTAQAALSETAVDFGRRRAALEGARAAYDVAVAGYQQTVLTAFQEVEDELASLRYLAEEAVHQQEAVTAAEQSLSLELDRYRAGTDSYLNVITTQTILLSDQQASVTILQRRLSAAVGLIKALGGGWDASELPTDESLRGVSPAGSPPPSDTRP